MPRIRTPDNLLTDAQRRKRAINDKYRKQAQSKKTYDNQSISNILNTSQITSNDLNKSQSISNDLEHKKATKLNCYFVSDLNKSQSNDLNQTISIKSPSMRSNNLIQMPKSYISNVVEKLEKFDSNPPAEPSFLNSQNIESDMNRRLELVKTNNQEELLQKLNENLEKIVEQQLSNSLKNEPIKTMVKKDEPFLENLVSKASQIIPRVLIIFGFTAFLMREQVHYFKTQDFELFESWMIAGLFEAALLILSFSIGGKNSKISKAIVSGLLIVGLYIMGSVVENSAVVRGDKKAKNADSVTVVNKEIEELEALSKLKLSNIEALDASIYPSKREALIKEYTETVSKKLDEKRALKAFMLSSGTSIISGETELMKKMRWFILAINVFFAHSLAVVWYRKKES